MSGRRAAVLVGLAAAIAAFFALGGHRLLAFENIKAQQAAIEAYYAAHPWQTAAAFFAAYVAVTGLSLPGAAVMTLAAGALFGLLWGTVIVSFAASIGATIAFLASRFLLRDWVQGRFARQLRRINEGFAREGGFYLFTLRLIPAVPFFAINLAMGLLPIRAWTFYWVSQLGMLAGTIVYVNAGTQLAQIQSPRDILSPELIGAFVLLGIFPLLASKVIDGIKAKRVYARWTRPRRFERNLVVIGAGAAGLVSAYIAAAVKAKVTLIEKDRMGGDCLNTGCVPSKALIKTARVLTQVRNARAYGLKSASAEVDFAQVMERVQRIVKEVEPHDSVERYTGLGVECLQGEARITSPWTVEIKTEKETIALTTRAIVIAAGAEPFVPPIPGIDKVGCLTSETLWDLRELPRRLVVLGGGPIGCELAQAFARLGSKVTQVEMLPRLLPREDPEVSEMIRRKFTEEGIQVLVGHKAEAFDGKVLTASHAGGKVAVEFDQVLCAVGRVARTKGYGLEALGIPTTRARTVETNEYLQTLYPNIYACGDVAGPYQFTHTASHQAWYAAVNALFAPLRRFRADYSVIPWATFTDPEVARVGLSESEAKEQGVAHEVTVYGLDELDRAIADSAAQGMVKVLTAPGSDRILGATIVGEHAGELIAEFVAAMRHGLGMNKVLGTIHIYPTFAEANRYAAGAWKRAHAPQGVLRAVEKLQAWMRG
ncbi:MAG: FAD-dependent oxidoreductase [Betaproteobacteria bacterium]